MPIPPLILRIYADSSGMGPGIAQANAQVGGLRGTFAAHADAMKLGLVAVGVAAVKFGVDSVKAFSEAQAVMAQTENVLASTGGAANVTAQDVLNLASKWQDLSGVEDDAIQASENLLLTFRSVHNEVGRGNDIFNQATGAILDMSTALNRGAVPSADMLQSSTIQLGKALNDPIAGMTALKRVGVSFTESQIATIKALQESGDLMGAQKVILGELEKEFGGAARAAGNTFAGQVAKLQANLNNLQEEIGSVLVPRLSLLAEVMNSIAQKELPSASTGVNLFKEGLHDLTSVASNLPGPLSGIGGALGPLDDLLQRQPEQLTLAKGAIENWAGAITQGSLTPDQLRAKLDQMGVSMEQSDKIVNDVRSTMVGWSEDTIKAAKASSGFAHMSVQDFNTWRQESVADLNSVSGSLEGLAEKAHLTAGQILRAFDKQLQAMEDYQKNWQTLLGRGLPDSLAQQLQEMGIKGAGIIDALANANEQRFNKIINDWQKAQREALVTANSVNHIGSAINALPNVTTLDIFVQTHGTGHPLPRQHGGPVSAFSPYVVGERGPELFVPSTSGTVVPSGGGGGGDVVFQIDGQTFARISRDELLKLKGSRVSLGLS